MQTLVSELNSRLEETRRAYYAGEPIMSDAEYDLLEQQLHGMVNAQPTLFSQAPVLTTVGTDVSGRIPHDIPMLSIQNVYTVEELTAWVDSLGGVALTIGSKLDGVSDSLKYEHGRLIQAV
ncbi:MAG TPA: hypothetical protein VE866_04750, partial [Candidatus Binatia bacterium]|nr:hypothetical protein [Candidatus Binatia bacterium]